MKKFKIVFLFLVFLSALTAGIAYFRNEYILRKQEEVIKYADELVDKGSIVSGLCFWQNASKGKMLNSSNNIEEKKEIELEFGTIGLIKIPSINVKAPVSEGTSVNILKYSVRAF